MKRVSNWFTAGTLFCAAWLLIKLILIVVTYQAEKDLQFFSSIQDYLLWMTFVEILLAIAGKFCIAFAGVVYLNNQIKIWEKTEEIKKLNSELLKNEEDVANIQQQSASRNI